VLKHPDGLQPPPPPLSAPDRVTLCRGLGIFMKHSAEPAGGIGKIDDREATSPIKNRDVRPRQNCPVG
jgi:hypothetical protein